MPAGPRAALPVAVSRHFVVGVVFDDLDLLFKEDEARRTTGRLVEGMSCGQGPV